MIHSVLFDLIGTTVKEEKDTILMSFSKAFQDHVGYIDINELTKNRGKDKKLIIAHLLSHHNYSLSFIQPIFNSFNSYVANSLYNFYEMDSAAEIFSFLKGKKIKTGIGTGLSRNLFDKIYNYLGWAKYDFDYVGISDEIAKSRPAPDMIFAMMTKTGMNDLKGFLKVGDTAADIQEGKNAGVITAVLLSGSQDKKDLINESPDFILNSLSEIKQIIAEKK